tara:strand:- start:4 stop:141 length:138 start_codon:yes stop_codon:yes gene_type:complete
MEMKMLGLRERRKEKKEVRRCSKEEEIFCERMREDAREDKGALEE